MKPATPANTAAAGTLFVCAPAVGTCVAVVVTGGADWVTVKVAGVLTTSVRVVWMISVTLPPGITMVLVTGNSRVSVTNTTSRDFSVVPGSVTVWNTVLGLDTSMTFVVVWTMVFLSPPTVMTSVTGWIFVTVWSSSSVAVAVTSGRSTVFWTVVGMLVSMSLVVVKVMVRSLPPMVVTRVTGHRLVMVVRETSVAVAVVSGCLTVSWMVVCTAVWIVFVVLNVLVTLVPEMVVTSVTGQTVVMVENSTSVAVTVRPGFVTVSGTVVCIAVVISFVVVKVTVTLVPEMVLVSVTGHRLVMVENCTSVAVFVRLGCRTVSWTVVGTIVSMTLVLVNVIVCFLPEIVVVSVTGQRLVKVVKTTSVFVRVFVGPGMLLTMVVGTWVTMVLVAVRVFTVVWPGPVMVSVTGQTVV